MSDHNTNDPHDDGHADEFDELEELGLFELYADDDDDEAPAEGPLHSDEPEPDVGPELLVDEDGNPIPEDQLHLYMDVDADEEEPAPSAPSATPPTQAGTAAGPRVPRVLIAGVVAGVVLLGGGATWFLSSLGEQNTAEDVATAVQTKTDAGKKKAKAKVDEVQHPPVDACDPGQLEGKTLWDEASGDAPMRLEILDIAPLPRGAAERVEAGGRTLEMETLQVSRYEWGIYFVEPPAPVARGEEPPVTWWKVDLDTSGDKMAMRELAWPGGDRAAMATCPLIERGAYQVVGENIPPGALGVRDGHVEVAMMMADASAPDADIVYGLVGTDLAKMRLGYAPDSEEADQAG